MNRRGADARQVALDALIRIEREDAWANAVVPAALDRSWLADRDRAFVTELVYGVTRMRRACDWLVGRRLDRPVDRLDAPTRNALRLGAYQLAFLATPAHAAVGETVGVAPARARGLVNAVLRRVADDVARGVRWPDPATRLSQPDWIVARLAADLGAADAEAALETMNCAAEVTVRADGYVQDRASQLVADAVAPGPGEVVADVCAAPGGKATALVRAGARVVALDVHEGRARRVVDNRSRLEIVGGALAVAVGDAAAPPLRPGSFDAVLVDAPCSGLGVLRRRPDARWRVRPDDVAALAALQRSLLDAAIGLLRPGGRLVYSVCTLTAAETVRVDDWLATAHPEIATTTPPAPWRPAGRGGRLLPQDLGSDGMFVLLGTLGR